MQTTRKISKISNVSGELRHIRELIAEMDKRYEQRFQYQESSVVAAMAASDRAIAKTELAVDRRFESVNEFRGQLKDQASTLITRAESEAKMGALFAKVDELSTKIEKSEGRGLGLNAGWIYLIGIISTVGAVASVVISFWKN